MRLSVLLREGRTFASLRRYRNFRLYTIGQAVSTAGSWAQAAALSWLVLGITHSALALGVLGVWTFGPYVALGLFGGVVSDRFDRRRILVVTQSAFLALARALDINLVIEGVSSQEIRDQAFAMGGTFAQGFHLAKPMSARRLKEWLD